MFFPLFFSHWVLHLDSPWPDITAVMNRIGKPIATCKFYDLQTISWSHPIVMNETCGDSKWGTARPSSGPKWETLINKICKCGIINQECIWTTGNKYIIKHILSPRDTQFNSNSLIFFLSLTISHKSPPIMRQYETINIKKQQKNKNIWTKRAFTHTLPHRRENPLRTINLASLIRFHSNTCSAVASSQRASLTPEWRCSHCIITARQRAHWSAQISHRIP